MSSFNSKLTKLILAEVEAAILKAATPVEGVTMPEFATAEEARDNFRDLVLADLTERLGVATKSKTKKTKEATVTVTIPEAAHAQEVAPVEEKKERKARSPMTPEKKAAMKAKRDATLAAKKAEAAPAEVPVVAAPAPAAAAESPKEKKKRGPMTEEAKAAMKAKRDATLAAKKEEGVVEKPKKAKVAEDANLAKVDPTWRKHLKTAAKAAGKEPSKEMEAALLTHLNGLSKEEFNAKKAEEHVSAFLAAPVEAAPEANKVPANLEVVEFEGKDYYVNPETKRVYEGEGEEDPETGGWTNYKPVGYVGMAAFAEMSLE
jgi:hypothetical protein